MLPSPGGSSVMSPKSFSPGGITASVGKVASALLAKHVRTLEVLHSLQKHNAELKHEIQEKSGEQEIGRKIAEAVAAAVAAPKDLIEELQSQGEKLKKRVAGLEEELALTEKASAKALEDANSRMNGLRTSNQTLEKKCKDLEFEARCQARRESREGDLESQLRESSAELALVEGRAADLVTRLAERESVSSTLKLRVKESEDEICAMKATEALQTAAADQAKTRIANLQLQARGLRDKLEATEAQRGQLGVRLEQTSLELEASKQENVKRATSEQRLLVKASEQSTRASAADAKLADERKRFQKLKEDAKRKLEEEARRCKETLMEYAYEREQLMQRIDALSRVIESLRSHMNNNRSQFSKYVEAKTENTQLKEELDGLREMVVAVPRPPHRSHSLGSGSSVMQSTLGGTINKHISMERLRHSISVARGHPTNSSSTSSKHSTGSTGSGNISIAGSRRDSFYDDSKSIGSGVGKHVLTRRHSSDQTGSGGGGGGGWTGTSQSPSSKFAVTPAGSSNDGNKRERREEIGARQRGMRPAQQVF